jgi:hypothetical protein
MTALVGGTVERTFSEVGEELTGLSRLETHEAERQDFGDLVEPLGGAQLVWMDRAHGRPLRWFADDDPG